MRKMAKITSLIIVSLILISMCSCSASYHLKTAKRKDPTLFLNKISVRVDTVFVDVPKVETSFIQVRDTVLKYEKGEVEIKYLWNTKTDSVYIDVTCPDKEVIIKEVLKTETVYIKPSFWEKIKWFIGFVVIGFVLVLIRKITA